MKRTWLFTLALLVLAEVARPAPSFGQEDSAKQGEEIISLDHSVTGITPPRTIYSPEPEYDDASRKEKRPGVVVLSLVVTKKGNAEDVKVIKSLAPRLDKQAVKAVSTWRFTPPQRTGTPLQPGSRSRSASESADTPDL